LEAPHTYGLWFSYLLSDELPCISALTRRLGFSTFSAKRGGGVLYPPEMADNNMIGIHGFTSKSMFHLTHTILATGSFIRTRHNYRPHLCFPSRLPCRSIRKQTDIALAKHTLAEDSTESQSWSCQLQNCDSVESLTTFIHGPLVNSENGTMMKPLKDVLSVLPPPTLVRLCQERPQPIRLQSDVQMIA
jgi:hypothetical protein